MGNAPCGQRSPGHSVATEQGPWKKWPNRRSNFLRRSTPVELQLRGEEAGKPRWRGVYARQRLSLHHRGKAGALTNGVQSRGQNRTREIRPSGIVGGL
jgi:hypothetical protein